MSITYQQAKRIRKVGLMSLFADQLMYEKKVTTAIAKTISLKTRGKIMGVTQYLDPLNIAKMLTFGSGLGPALLGHWMGRDPRDIQYFTGRLKPIREKSKTGDKITKLTGTGATNTEGMAIVLRKMHKLMAGIHEENVKRYELAKNREEERQLEDERRHKELLETLSSYSPTATIIKGEPTKESPGFMGLLGDMIERIKSWVTDFINKFDFTDILGKMFGGAKIFGSLLSFLGSSLFRMVLMNPAVLAVATILGLAELLSYAVKQFENKNVVTPIQAANILQNAQYESDLKRFGGAEKLRDIIVNGPKRAQEILERGDIEEINREGGLAFLSEVASQTEVPVPETNLVKIQKVPPRPDTTGGKNQRRAADWDKKFGYEFNPTTGEVDTSINDAEMRKLTRQAQQTVPTQLSAYDVTDKLNTVQNENIETKLTAAANKATPVTQVNNNTVNTQQNKTVPIKRDVPSVRMPDPEFQNRIYQNTVTAN
jgi:hypothetical protein